MQVTAIELEGMEAGQDSIMYDITLCEIQRDGGSNCATCDQRLLLIMNNILLYIS